MMTKSCNATVIMLVLSVYILIMVYPLYKVSFCATNEPIAVFEGERIKSLASNNDLVIHPKEDAEDMHSIGAGKNHPIDVSCPRFATIGHTRSAGLGHKLTEVVFGMIFAEETNSTFVLDDRIWSHEGKHGSYSWLMSVLPLDQTEFVSSEFEFFSKNSAVNISTVDGRWDSLVNESKHETRTCNILYKTYLHWCCDEKDVCYCTFLKSKVGSFDRVKWRMREAFSRSNFVPSQKLHYIGAVPEDEPVITITWHVRQGDIVLNANKEHFSRIASQITSVLSTREIPVHLFILGENEIFEKFPFLPDMCKQYFQGNCSYPALDVQDTLYYMVKSDVLITSGSSFPAIAALLRTDGIVLYEYPKEMVTGIYEVGEQGLISRNGTIERPSLQELKYRLEIIFNQKVK